MREKALRSRAFSYLKLYGIMIGMKLPDVDRIRSETSLTIEEFLECYNDDLPEQFPRASKALLEEFRRDHASLFARTDAWSLDQHRKKIMDWLPARVKVA